MDMEDFYTQMVIAMKENGLKVNFMDTVTSEAEVEAKSIIVIYIRGNGRPIYATDMGSRNG